MSLPPARDAAARRLVLTAVGALLVAALPAGLFGEASLWDTFGRPGPPPASLLALAFLLAGWLYFSLMVFARSGEPGLAGHLPAVVDTLGLLVFVVATVVGLIHVAIGALLVAAAVQLLVAPRLPRKAGARMVVPSQS